MFVKNLRDHWNSWKITCIFKVVLTQTWIESGYCLQKDDAMLKSEAAR